MPWEPGSGPAKPAPLSLGPVHSGGAPGGHVAAEAAVSWKVLGKHGGGVSCWGGGGEMEPGPHPSLRVGFLNLCLCVAWGPDLQPGPLAASLCPAETRLAWLHGVGHPPPSQGRSTLCPSWRSLRSRETSRLELLLRVPPRAWPASSWLHRMAFLRPRGSPAAVP